MPHSFEEYLKDCFIEETRIINLPDDSKCCVKGFKYCWKAYDFLLVFGNYNQATLVRMTVAMNELSGRSFEADFFTIVGSAHSHLTKKLGFDLF